MGMGIKNYPIIAPETAVPRDVPVDITILDIGAIFLDGTLL